MHCLTALLVFGASVAAQSASTLPAEVRGTWLLVEAPGPTDRRWPVAVTFSQSGSASWSDGCNSTSAQLEMLGSSFHLGDVSSTLLACTPAPQPLRVPFPAEGRFEFVAGELHVIGPDGILRFQRARAAR